MSRLSAMASSVGERLKASGASLGVSESSCGGLISATLVAVPGASAYYLGGGVIYTASSRQGLLAIGPQAMQGLRASTEAYALLNARTIRETLGATWGLAETGASGPTGNRYGDAAGHACIAVAGPVTRAITLETGVADREANMWTFAQAALDLLLACLSEADGAG